MEIVLEESEIERIQNDPIFKIVFDLVKKLNEPIRITGGTANRLLQSGRYVDGCDVDLKVVFQDLESLQSFMLGDTSDNSFISDALGLQGGFFIYSNKEKYVFMDTLVDGQKCDVTLETKRDPELSCWQSYVEV